MVNTSTKLVTIDDLVVGQEMTYRVCVDEAMVEAYAKLVDDYNPVHCDKDYAATTQYGRPIAHGLLVAGFVQHGLTALVTPGGVSTAYSFQLVRPVPVGSEVIVKVRCVSVNRERRRATFDVEVAVVGEEAAIRGSAEIAFPRPKMRDPKS